MFLKELTAAYLDCFLKLSKGNHSAARRPPNVLDELDVHHGGSRKRTDIWNRSFITFSALIGVPKSTGFVSWTAMEHNRGTRVSFLALM